jgi:integrase
MNTPETTIDTSALPDYAPVPRSAIDGEVELDAARHRPTPSRTCALASVGEERETKTRRDRTVRLLRPLAEDLKAARVSLGRIPSSSERIFPRSSDGRDWTEFCYRNWRRRVFKQAVRKAGLPESTRPYDLRHAFCSLLIAEGASVVEVAAQAGHAPTMTLNTYAHVMEEMTGRQRTDAATAIRRARVSQVRHRQARRASDAPETATVGVLPT